MVRRTYSIRETCTEPNSYTIYRLDDPPANIPDIEALTSYSHSWVRVNPNQLEGHWLIEQIFVRGLDHVERVPIGIAHTEEELPDKVYNLVKRVALQLAQKELFSFRNLTRRLE